MQIIKFSQNWNGKLNCTAFTTIRLHNPQKHQIGQYYEIQHNSHTKGIAKLIDIETFTIDKINERVAYLDTGYSREKTINIIKNMYKNFGLNWDTQQIDVLLLIYINTNQKPTRQTNMFFN